jgi:hypothetical protein
MGRPGARPGRPGGRDGFATSHVYSSDVKPAIALGFWISVALVFWAAPADAAGANEWQLSLRAGIGVVNVGSDPWGLAGGADVEYGLTDAWALRASLEGSTSSVSANKQAGTAAGSERMDAALAGVTYTIDVLRLVPYATLQFGIAQISGPLAAPVTMFASELGLGGDYYLTRQLRAGISFQYLYRPQDLLQNPEGLGNAPFTFSATARFGWVF